LLFITFHTGILNGIYDLSGIGKRIFLAPRFYKYADYRPIINHTQV